MKGIVGSTFAYAFRRATLPLGCYYAVTLGLPLANGAAHTGAAFGGHAVVVLTVPLLLIVLVGGIHAGGRVCGRTVVRSMSAFGVTRGRPGPCRFDPL